MPPALARPLVAGAAAALLALACSANPVLQSSSPLTTGAPLRLARLAVVALADDDGIRRKVEESFVASLGAVRGEASYRVIVAGTEQDAVRIKRDLVDSGFDGAMLVRVLSSSAIDEASGSWSYPDMGGWEASGTARYTPGMQTLRESMRFEVEVYALHDDRLAWRAVSVTGHPSNLDRLAGRVARAVVDELESRQVISAPSR